MAAPASVVLKYVSVGIGIYSHHAWRCGFSGCTYEHMSLITAMFHLQDDHKVPVDQMVIHGDMVLWKNGEGKE